LPRCILPLARDTIIHIRARLRKKGVWEGRTDLRLAGFIHTRMRKDAASIAISAIIVTILNFRISIRPSPKYRVK
jgi:hypothetical protein